MLGAREMPGAEWFPGATLNYAEHMLHDSDEVAVIARSQSREPFEWTFRELRERVAGARAELQRLGVGSGDRVVAYVPNIPETLVGFLAAASLGAIWASVSPEFGPRSVIDRFAQVEPKVLVAVDGYTHRGKLIDRREEVAAIRAGLADARAHHRARVADAAASWRSSPCRSTTRCTCCSAAARPGCRSRSCTATAASCSSTTRTWG